jgi:hypothetical protein
MTWALPSHAALCFSLFDLSAEAGKVQRNRMTAIVRCLVMRNGSILIIFCPTVFISPTGYRYVSLDRNFNHEQADFGRGSLSTIKPVARPVRMFSDLIKSPEWFVKPWFSDMHARHIENVGESEFSVGNPGPPAIAARLVLMIAGAASGHRADDLAPLFISTHPGHVRQVKGMVRRRSGAGGFVA